MSNLTIFVPGRGTVKIWHVHGDRFTVTVHRLFSGYSTSSTSGRGIPRNLDELIDLYPHFRSDVQWVRNYNPRSHPDYKTRMKHQDLFLSKEDKQILGLLPI